MAQLSAVVISLICIFTLCFTTGTANWIEESLNLQITFIDHLMQPPLTFDLLFSLQAQITNAMVASIYQQELAKMAGQPVPHGAVPSSAHTPTPHPEHGSRSSTRGPYPAKRSDSIDSNSSGRGRRIQTDDKNLSEEMVSRIYQEELAKLARQAQKSGNPAEFNMYQQELQRIATEANKKGHKPQTQVRMGVYVLSLGRRNTKEIVKIKFL